MKKITVLLILAFAFSSCFNNYFKVKTETEWKEDQLQILKESEKRIVIHFPNAMKLLGNPVYESDQITGKLETYYAMATQYVDPNTDKNKNFKYKYRYRDVIFSEVHVYVNENYSDQIEYRINKDNFVKSNIYAPNKGLSIGSHVLGATIIVAVLGSMLAVAAGAAGVAMGAAMATSFNCPQVYVETSPGHYQFIGGLFTGALTKDLERMDMMLIPHTASDTIRIRINGMQNEIQYLDYAALKQVVHPQGTEVVGNRHGDMFIIRHLKMPAEIRAGEMTDRSKNLLFRDGQSYSFHITDSSDHAFVQLKFARKESDNKAVLVARMKNSDWGGYITNELRRTTAFPVSGKENYQQIVSSTAMKVSLMTKRGWRTVDYFPPAGNTATRDLAMELDLSEIDGRDVILKMEAPYRFWDLDQVGLSYEVIKPMTISNNCMLSATVAGVDYSYSIQRKDGVYLTLGATDQLELAFPKTPVDNSLGTKVSYVLAAGGYYHQVPHSDSQNAYSTVRFGEYSSLNRYSIAKYKELGFKY